MGIITAGNVTVSSSAAVPADVPLFSTVPIERVYFDVGLVPVMACTVQRRSDMLPPKLLHSEELVAVPFTSFLPFTTEFPASHLTLLGQLNLQFDGSSAVGMMIFEQTFTCQAHRGGELIRHNTTFFRDRKLFGVVAGSLYKQCSRLYTHTYVHVVCHSVWIVSVASG